MIASISGSVQRIEEDHLIIQVGGFGLKVWVPVTALEVAGAVGTAITLFTYLHWRDNEIALYGFTTQDELDLFELLLGVSGIGPRLALSIVSTLSPEVLTGAVAQDEPAVLQRVPGIGKKTAERILFHLKDRMDLDHLPGGVAIISDLDSQVIAALTSLGYSIVEAQTAVQRIPRDAPRELEERIRLALSAMGV